MSRTLRALIAPAVATLLGVALLVALGNWQIRRLAWKEALIAAVDTRAHAPPVAPPAEADWPSLDPAATEYRRVRLTGVFDGAKQVLVYRALGEPRGRYGGQGYLVLTPLRLASGANVLVDRGFVPEDDKAAAGDGLGGGETNVTGLMRASEARNWFTPADDPAKGEWFTRDIGAIARAEGLTRVAPFIVDADAWRRRERTAGGRRNAPRVSQQPSCLCADLVRPRRRAGRRLHRLRRLSPSRRRAVVSPWLARWRQRGRARGPLTRQSLRCRRRLGRVARPAALCRETSAKRGRSEGTTMERFVTNSSRGPAPALSGAASWRWYLHYLRDPLDFFATVQRQYGQMAVLGNPVPFVARRPTLHRYGRLANQSHRSWPDRRLQARRPGSARPEELGASPNPPGPVLDVSAPTRPPIAG